MRKKLPVGIENFESFSEQDYYYVDKTGLITELLNNGGAVNLFTRPRRFGKSLNMSMLKSFFQIGTKAELFDGLSVSAEEKLCEEHLGKYPVVSITLKGAGGISFDAAKDALRFLVGNAAGQYAFLATSEKLSSEEKRAYSSLTAVSDDGSYLMSDVAMNNSLMTLSKLLYKYYGRQTVLLIDEYDVPLDRAYQSGYYDEMVDLLRSFLGNALKTNEYLQLAVLTGCLRVSKESIFTGLNNLRVNSITDTVYDEYFGFTDIEVQRMLEYYGLSQHYEAVKQWYDGYQFGNTYVYCPWDVINFCYDARFEADPILRNYWANTSGNEMVRRFIDKANAQTRNEIEQLIEGKSIIKPVSQELTYSELDSSIENLWSVLFITGYLTKRRNAGEKKYELAIPNREIRELFINHIREWFNAAATRDHSRIEKFCAAFLQGDAETIEIQLNKYLWDSISVRDDAVRSDRKENFYHGLLLGLLQYEDNWLIKSNAESGLGYSDLLIETPERIGVVIELKYADNNNLEQHCTEAMAQIEEKQYDARLIEDGMDKILRFGIAFYKKRCKVVTK